MSSPASPVVIAGTAALSGAGLGRDALWQRLRDGAAPSDPAHRFPPDLTNGIRDRRLGSPHPQAARVIAAVERELGGLLKQLNDAQRDRAAVAIGTAYGHLDAYLGYFGAAIERGPMGVNPSSYLYTAPSSSSAELSRAYGLRGSCTTLSSGDCAGLDAVGYGVDAVARGEELVVLAGGLEEVSAYTEALLGPDRAGDGFAVLLLCTPATAEQLGWTSLARVGTVASTRCPAGALRAAAGQARAASMVAKALATVGAVPAEVDVVLPSAGGAQGDGFELAVLRAVFGSRADAMAVTPISGVTGECFAASGPLQCAAAVRALDPGGNGGAPARVALVTSSGADGSFAAVALRRADSC